MDPYVREVHGTWSIIDKRDNLFIVFINVYGRRPLGHTFRLYTYRLQIGGIIYERLTVAHEFLNNFKT